MRRDCKVCGSANRSRHHRMACLKGFKFIRVVKKSCATKLRLPSRYARNVGEFLQDGALLYANDVDVCRVEVTHSNGGCSFSNGWAKFFEGFKVSKGSVLMFKYLGHSTFKVDIFNAHTGLLVDKPVSNGNGAAEGESIPAGEAEVKRVGRPPVLYRESEEVGDVRLYGMKLKRFTMYNLRAELWRRRLEQGGCKGELLEKLGRFIMRHGPDFHYEKVRIGKDWGWVQN